jgi:hypothetical protein
MKSLIHRLNESIGLDEGLTSQAERLDAALDEFRKSLADVSQSMGSRWRRDYKPPDSDKVNRLVAASKALVPMLSIRTERKDSQDFFNKKILGRVRNFKKIVVKLSEVKSPDEMRDYLESLDTKTKGYWEKIWDYMDNVRSIIRAFDTEKEGSIEAGPWTVRLMSEPYTDWDRKNSGIAKAAIGKAARKLKASGLGKAVGGTMHAWPGDWVPPSANGRRGVLASYNFAHDTLNVAVGRGDVDAIYGTMIHELGHRYYYRVMGNRGRAAWKQFFDAGKGKVPDADYIIKTWDILLKRAFNHPRMTQKDFESMKTSHGFFDIILKSMPENYKFWGRVLWSRLEVGKLEKLNKRTGLPRKGSPSAYDIFKDKAREIDVFLKPVTVYSTTDEDELFAETFEAYVTEGPRRIPPVVLMAFKQAVPELSR